MSEHSPRKSRHEIDVRALMDNPKFKKDVSDLDFLLAANTDEGDMTIEDREAEYHEFVAFNEEYFPTHLLERPVTFFTAYNDPKTGKLGVDEITGKFIGARSMIYTPENDVVDAAEVRVTKGIARRALGYLFRNDSEEGGMGVIRVDNNLILSMTIETPPPITEKMTTREVLAILGENFTHTVNTQTFFEADLERQQMHIITLMDEVAEHYPVFLSEDKPHAFVIDDPDNDDEPSSIITKEARLTFPGLEEREKSYRSAEDFLLNDELYVSLTEDNGVVHTIPLSHIADIRSHIATTIPDSMPAELPEIEREEDEVDFLAKLNDPTFRAFVSEVENDLNTDYPPFDEIDDTQFTEDKIMYLIQLDAMAAQGIDRYAFRLTGIIYHHDEESEHHLNVSGWESYEKAVSQGFDIKLIDNKWRVVLAQEVLTGESEETTEGVEDLTEQFYIIPTRDRLAELIGYRSDDDVHEQDSGQNLQQELHDVTDRCQFLVQSDAFAQLGLADQIQALRMMYQEAKQRVEALAVHYSGKTGHAKIHCSTTRYWSTEWQENEDTPPTSDIARTLGYIGDHRDPFILSGESVTLDIPELNDSRSERFTGTSSFPLSNGMPMIIIEDGVEMKTHYVPVSEMKFIAPSDNRLS